jgi:Ca2+-binding EF-hand superfamily protein
LDRDGDGYLNENDLRITFEKLGWDKKYDLAKIISSMSEQHDGRIGYEGKNYFLNVF